MAELTLRTPTIVNLNAFDVDKGTVIEFTARSDGAEIINSSKVEFFDTVGGKKVAEHIYNSRMFEHKIPPKLPGIVNGKNYAITITVYVGQNATGNFSAPSTPPQQVWCVQSPTLEFIQPAGLTTEINTNSYTFEAKFKSPTDNLPSNLIQYYKFTLYNATGQVVQSQNIVFGQGSPLAENEYLLKANFIGLGNNTTYYCVLEVKTELDMVLTARSEGVTVKSSEITYSQASVSNNSCGGYISIISNLTNINGESNREPEHNRIDLTDGGYLIWDSGYSFPTLSIGGVLRSRWTLKMQGFNFTAIKNYLENPLINDKYIISLSNMGTNKQNNFIRVYVVEIEDNIRLDLFVKGENNLDTLYYTQSNTIPKPIETNRIGMSIRCIDGLFDIKLENMGVV